MLQPHKGSQLTLCTSLLARAFWNIPAFVCASTVHSTGTQTRIHLLLKIHFKNQDKHKDCMIELKT